jgi:hypothetical protein
MNLKNLENKTFIGIVMNNEDPENLGRCKVKVIDVLEGMPDEDLPWALPWKDLNGNQFILPDKGKIVSVIFDGGNQYRPEYIFAEHFNINLEKKLKELSGKSYTSMRALVFDHKTQIFSNDTDGLMIDYKFNQINITKDQIALNLKDNMSLLRLGTDNADQQAILGNHFLDWFDEFLDNMLGSNGGPYLGNLGAPVIANPALISCILRYKVSKDPIFLSHHVNIVDNNLVNKVDRIAEGQIGDQWKSTVTANTPNNLTSGEQVDYAPRLGQSTDTPDSEVTSSFDENGNQIPNDDGSPIPDPSPTDNGELLRIVNYIQRYTTLTPNPYILNTRPYEMNIVGIRRSYEGQNYTNKHSDYLWLFWKNDSNQWQYRRYAISTMPGYYQAVYTENPPKLRPARSDQDKEIAIDVKTAPSIKSKGGMGVMTEGFYKNMYRIGNFHGKLAMLNVSPHNFYLDDREGSQIRFKKDNSGKTIVKKGITGMHIHHGSPGGRTVDNYSRGCQVFQNESDREAFFRICEQHKKRYGNSFNYTLIRERDL